ncbi:MAG: GNAT family N-acetyltransferase [Planctomycetota bacterium]
MILRGYEPGDLESVAGLITDSIHGLAVTAYDARQLDAWAPRPPDLEHWRRRLGSMHVVLACEDGRPSGVIGFHASGHVDLLFTHPDAARRGVAAALHAEVERRLAADGVTELFTEASEIARPFFGSRGYVVVRREVVQARGVDLHRYVMRRAGPRAR